MAKAAARHLVVCIDNEGYEVSLDKRKCYVALREIKASDKGLLRIVDESGEGYLYPKTMFRTIALPDSVRKAVLAPASRSNSDARIWSMRSSSRPL